MGLADLEIEQASKPLFDYFDANLQTLNIYLSDAKGMVMTRVWKEIIERLLIPPLNDISSEIKPLSNKFQMVGGIFFLQTLLSLSVNNLLFLVFAKLLQ